MLTIALVVVGVLAITLWLWKVGASPADSAERDLLRMVHGDMAKANRLIDAEISQQPHLTRANAAALARDRLRHARSR